MLGRRSQRDFEDEIRSHLELEAEDRRQDGASSDEARYAARRAFGNVATTKEDVRAAWGWTRTQAR